MGLNDALCSELASYGIRVTAICPGWVKTDMARISSLQDEDKIPIEDIAKTVSFLLGVSSNSCIREVIIECRKTIELIHSSPLKNK